MSEKNSTLKPKRGQLVIEESQTGDHSMRAFICLGWTGSFVLLREIQESGPVDNDELWFENWENPAKNRTHVFTTIPLPEPIIEAWAKILPKTITPVSEMETI